MRRKGFDDPFIRKLATGLTSHWKVFKYAPLLIVYFYHLMSVSSRFVSAMYGCLQGLGPDEVNGLLEDDTQRTIWAEVFRLHYLLRR